MENRKLLEKLHEFFTHSSQHHLEKKIVFAPGTAPMRRENVEVHDILFATDFDKAYLVDPVYSVSGKDSPLQWDVDMVRRNDSQAVFHADTNGHTHVTFFYENRKKEIVFMPGDATLPENQPKDCTIFFSGKRIGRYPGVGLRGTPSEYLHEILVRLPQGGYVVPDRDLLDDSVYFLLPLYELGLEEVSGIRVPIPRADFPQGYSEGKRFIHSETAPGVGLYKKVR